MPFRPHLELMLGQWNAPEHYTFACTADELHQRIQHFAEQANAVKEAWYEKTLFSISSPKHPRLLTQSGNDYTFAIGRSSRSDMMLKAKLNIDETRTRISVNYALSRWDRFRAILFTVFGTLFFLLVHLFYQLVQLLTRGHLCSLCPFGC